LKMQSVKNFYKWLLTLFMWFFVAHLFSQKDSIPIHQKFFDDGIKLIDSARYKEAIPLLKKAYKNKPDYWEAMNKSAYAYHKLVDYKNAKKELDKAQTIAPLNYEGLKLKAIVLFQNNEFAACKPVLDTAFYIWNEEKIEDEELLYYRALLMFKGKNYRGALDVCESATDLKARYTDVIALKGEIRFVLKEYNYAIKELSEAINLMPMDKPNVETYKLRAKSKFEVGDFKGAIKDWNVFLDSNPNDEEALISRASAKINANENSGAISDLDMAIKLNPKNAVSYCYRGVAKGGNRNFVEALKDLDYSIKLKFNYPAAYVNRAAIKLAVKDKRGACEDLEKADSLGSETAIKLIERYCKQGR